MRIEKISGNKIKITVTHDDMMQWGISFESIAENPPEAHDWFWSILRHAEDEADFDIDNSQLMIEAMAGKNDEIILLLTRLGEAESIEGLRIKKGRYRVKRPAINREEHSVLYCFDDFEHMCTFAKDWQSIGEKSSVYLYDGKYFLHLALDREQHSEEYVHSVVSEYASRVSLPTLCAAFLKEHGRVICEDNGIETIAKHF